MRGSPEVHTYPDKMENDSRENAFKYASRVAKAAGKFGPADHKEDWWAEFYGREPVKITGY